jgi:hypothetical protein
MSYPDPLFSPSGRQRSDFMSFQTSIISCVLPPAIEVDMATPPCWLPSI